MFSKFKLLSHLCFTAKNKDDNSSVQSRTLAIKLLFPKFLSGLCYKASEVSQSCPGKVVTFVQESLLILAVRHMNNTCPGWIHGINESGNVKGNQYLSNAPFM